MTKILVQQYNCPVGLACQLMGLAHSSFYYQNKVRDENQLMQAMEKVIGEFPKYGTRRVMYQLRRPPYGYRINRKRIKRIMRKKAWLQPVKRRQCRTTNSDHPYPRYPNLVKELEICYPEQVWVSDITYIRLGAGFVYLAIVMDVFTRAIRGWHLSKSLDQELSLAALRRGLESHVPEIHHSDQGVQYAANAYIDLLRAHHISISMAAVGKAEENGYAERFMRTIKEEEVDLSEYRDFADVLAQIGRFIDDVYMTKRIHSSLGYLTPAEFEAAWRSATPETTYP